MMGLAEDIAAALERQNALTAALQKAAEESEAEKEQARGAPHTPQGATT